jgi:hypothetical protein
MLDPSFDGISESDWFFRRLDLGMQVCIEAITAKQIRSAPPPTEDLKSHRPSAYPLSGGFEIHAVIAGFLCPFR